MTPSRPFYQSVTIINLHAIEQAKYLEFCKDKFLAAGKQLDDSVVDVIYALTDSAIPKRYWTDLKRKLIDEGSQLYDKIVRFKIKAKDGKTGSSWSDQCD